MGTRGQNFAARTGRGQQMGVDLLPLVYDGLVRVAARHLAHEVPGQSIQTTDLVHEAWLRVGGEHDHLWNSRGHFFCAAAEAIRRILIEVARRKARRKRGSGAEHLPIESFAFSAPSPQDQFLAVDEALEDLSQLDARAAELVKLRFFHGLSQNAAAQQLGISRSTADRSWSFARSWLSSQIRMSECRSADNGHGK